MAGVLRGLVRRRTILRAVVASPQWKKLKKKVMKLRKELKELKKELNRARKVLEVEQAVVRVLEQSLVLERAHSAAMAAGRGRAPVLLGDWQVVPQLCVHAGRDHLPRQFRDGRGGADRGGGLAVRDDGKWVVRKLAGLVVLGGRVVDPTTTIASAIAPPSWSTAPAWFGLVAIAPPLLLKRLMKMVANPPSMIGVMTTCCPTCPAELVGGVALNSAPLWMISAIPKRNSDR
eukprot:SAG22_NODE_100_length_20558_cov_10.189305_1_plen_232_part_00